MNMSIEIAVINSLGGRLSGDRVSAEVVSLRSLNNPGKSGLQCSNPCPLFTLCYMKIDGSGIRVCWPLVIASARWKTEVDFCSVFP